jgi:hypothetical protein
MNTANAPSTIARIRRSNVNAPKESNAAANALVSAMMEHVKVIPTVNVLPTELHSTKPSRKSHALKSLSLRPFPKRHRIVSEAPLTGFRKCVFIPVVSFGSYTLLKTCLPALATDAAYASALLFFKTG